LAKIRDYYHRWMPEVGPEPVTRKPFTSDVIEYDVRMSDISDIRVF